MDTQTRHALREDKLVNATTSGLSWIELHRTEAVRAAIAAVVLIAALVGVAAYYQHRSSQAQIALGSALQIYNSPLRQPGEPDDGSFNTIADRAKAANQKFVDVANEYGNLEAGNIARYFAALSDIDLGKNTDAENYLNKVSSSYHKDMSSLAKVALAGLYVRTGRTPQAVDLYNKLIASPTDTVPASAAQLQLAQIYETTDPQKARQIYALLKDKEKATAAGQIATQKLNPTAAAAPPPQLQ